jgi:hypothetical protein
MLMQRTFVALAGFYEDWTRVGLDDDSLSRFEIHLMAHPEVGDVVSGTNGVRKVRWARYGMGKSGGVRVFYLDIPKLSKLYLLALLQKSESAHLSKHERNELAKLVSRLKGEVCHGCSIQ